MKYINKNTGDLISQSVYLQLSEIAKSNFIQSSDVSHTTTHNITETKSDSLSIGDAIVGVALSPIIIFKSLF